MKHKNTLNEVPHRREKILLAWQTCAEGDSFAGMTREEFAVATEESVQKRRELEEAQARVTGLMQERELADAKTRELLFRVVHAVRGDPKHGEKGAMYRTMGYMPPSERARGLQRKLAE
jgi:hypothetical protein